MKSHKIVIYIFLLILLACNNTNTDVTTTKEPNHTFEKIEPKERLFNLSGLDRRGYRYGKFEVTTLDNISHYLEWLIFKNQADKSVISLPNTWSMKKDKDIYLLANTDSTKENFFLWKRYDKDSLDIELVPFVKYFHSVISSDISEVASDIEVKKYISNESKIGYYFDCTMERDKRIAKVCSFITEDGGKIHEFTIKTFNDKRLNKILFDLILEGILVNGNSIVDKSKLKIESIMFGIK